MCEQEKLYLLQAYSLAVATDAGVALGGLILIYFGSCFMHAYLISEHTHAGYDYRKVRRQAVTLSTGLRIRLLHAVSMSMPKCCAACHCCCRTAL